MVDIVHFDKPSNKNELILQTKVHRAEVHDFAVVFISYLMSLVANHDDSKFKNIDLFFDYMKSSDKDNHPWLKLHQKVESHHLFDNNLKVSLIDVIELICDWLSASERTLDNMTVEDFIKSRWSVDLVKDRLYQAFLNTFIVLKADVRYITFQSKK